MMISMDPDDDNSRTLTLDSPEYPNLYPNNQNCTWIITATYGQLAMVFNKFTVQSDSTCSEDYLQISGPINNYKRVKLCGFPVTPLISRIILTEQNLFPGSCRLSHHLEEV